MTDYQTITLELKDKVAHLTLNRPEKRNAMNFRFWKEIRQAFEELNTQQQARVAVISSTGPHFSSGIDLKAFSMLLMRVADCEGRRREALRNLILALQESFNAIEKCRIPVIAAIQGGCIGGGVDMVSACDIRLCSSDCYLVIKEIDIGMTADVGTLQRLPHLIPRGLVNELAYTGRSLKADEALKHGLVNSVHDSHESLNAAALEMARVIASKSPLAVTGTKRMLLYARDHDVNAGLDYVATWNSGQLISNDLMEAMMAMQQKREPEFKDLLEPFELG